MRCLTAAHAKGTVRALKPCAHHLSPALGLLSLGAHHWHGNLVRSSVPSPSTALARELFAEPTGHSPVRLSRSRSRAAAHLGSAQIGTILGLGLNNFTDAHDVKAALNRAGIETNRVHGEWTGVSLRRFLRLVELVREGGECAPAVALLLRLGWERAESKRDVLDFLLALDRERPVLAYGLRDDAAAQAAFVDAAFDDAHELNDAAAGSSLAFLASDAADDARADANFASALEVCAAALSQAHAHKAAIGVRRHTYDGSAPTPDCAEVVVRELLELLTFDSHARTFDVARLPAGAHPALRQMLSGADALLDDDARSATFYPLAQELPGACEYISTTPSGRRFELRPTMRSVAAATAALLGLGPVASTAELAAAWNAQCAPGAALEVTALEPARGGANAAVPEAARFQLRGGRHAIEVHLLDAVMYHVSVLHRAELPREALADARRHLARRYAAGGGTRRRALSAVYAPLLGDAMLTTLLRADAPPPPLPQLLEAVHAARWGADARRWEPLSDESNAAQLPSEMIAKGEALLALRTRTLGAIRALCAAGGAEAAAAAAISDLIDDAASDVVDAAALAAALGGAEPSLLRQLEPAIARRPDGALLAAMLGRGRALDLVRNPVQLMRYALTPRAQAT